MTIRTGHGSGGALRGRLTAGTFAAATAVIVLAGTGGFGCSAAPDEQLETTREAGEARSELWATRASALWPGGIVPVCFHPRVPVTDPDYITQRDRIRALTEAAYESIPGVDLDLQGWNECPNLDVGSLPGQLRVIVNPRSSTSVWFMRACPEGTTIDETGSCPSIAGYSSDLEPIVFVKGAYYEWGDHWDSAVLHEMAHALGFKHEQSREDNDGQCDTAAGTGSSGLFFTRYDHESITNQTYCGWRPELSDLDELGLEIAYPGDFDHPLRAWNGLSLGGGLVVRNDDSLVDDWTWRGATDEVYAWDTILSETIKFDWFEGSSVVRNDIELPASQLGEGSHTVSARFYDLGDRRHDVDATAVTVDTSLHTALLAVATGIL